MTWGGSIQCNSPKIHATSLRWGNSLSQRNSLSQKNSLPQRNSLPILGNSS